MLNRKQIDNLSRYCYDISKLIVGIVVIGNFLSDKFSLNLFLAGTGGTILFLITGYFLDGMEVE